MAAALIRASAGADKEPEGVVRLTASQFIGVEVLPAILTAFREAHPKIVIELSLSNLNQDLLRRDADIAVRIARPTQGASWRAESRQKSGLRRGRQRRHPGLYPPTFRRGSH
ncbi:MAG: LysR substrate-binding domain-containing protein [Rhizomicrobium sp.]